MNVYRVRRFESGVLVVQGLSHDEASIITNTKDMVCVYSYTRIHTYTYTMFDRLKCNMVVQHTTCVCLSPQLEREGSLSAEELAALVSVSITLAAERYRIWNEPPISYVIPSHPPPPPPPPPQAVDNGKGR